MVSVVNHLRSSTYYGIRRKSLIEARAISGCSKNPFVTVGFFGHLALGNCGFIGCIKQLGIGHFWIARQMLGLFRREEREPRSKPSSLSFWKGCTKALLKVYRIARPRAPVTRGRDRHRMSGMTPSSIGRPLGVCLRGAWLITSACYAQTILT